MPVFSVKVTMILSCFYTAAGCSCRGSGGGSPPGGVSLNRVNFSKHGALYGCHTKGEIRIRWVWSKSQDGRIRRFKNEACYGDVSVSMHGQYRL